MDIKDFKDTPIDDFIKNNGNVKMSNEEQDAMQSLKERYGAQVEELIDKFQNLSEPELIAEFFNLINEKKRNGTFNSQEIQNIANIISPLLNEEQLEKMRNLLLLIQ